MRRVLCAVWQFCRFLFLASVGAEVFLTGEVGILGRLLGGLLFCFCFLWGGGVGVWGFLVFLRMAVAGLLH